jgi:hypothetical protein
VAAVDDLLAPTAAWEAHSYPFMLLRRRCRAARAAVAAKRVHRTLCGGLAGLGHDAYADPNRQGPRQAGT